MFSQQFRFREKFFEEKVKVSNFLANSTPVTWRNECQKTFGEVPRSVCNTIHVFQITNTANVVRVDAKIFSMPMKDNERQDFCLKRKNKCSQVNSQSVRICPKQTKMWNLRAHKPSPEADFVTR